MIRTFTHSGRAFVLLPTFFRTFTHALSYFHTRTCKKKSVGSICYKLFFFLNTDSNTYLTLQPVDNYKLYPQTLSKVS